MELSSLNAGMTAAILAPNLIPVLPFPWSGLVLFLRIL
jgi:hypothetical protein